VADVVFMALHTLSIDLRAFVASEIVALSRELREHGDKGRDLTNIWLVRAHPQPISTHLNSSQLISTPSHLLPSPHPISSHPISSQVGAELHDAPLLKAKLVGMCGVSVWGMNANLGEAKSDRCT
jgi:hypothetical protein